MENPTAQPPVVETPAPKASQEKDVAEIKEQLIAVEKRLKDKDDYIGRMSNELGELRKKVAPPEQIAEVKDELVGELTRSLRGKGLDEETAKYNAEILAEASSKVLEKKLGDRLKDDVLDLMEEDFEDKKMDQKLFDENQSEIWAEVRNRKAAPTARKNLRIIRDCYDMVVQKKAHAMKELNKTKDEKKRDGIISNAGIPPQAARETVKTEDNAKEMEAIRNAGPKRSSVFF